MSFSVVIPARFASTRLPGKMLADIAGKPMIAHVVDRAQESAARRVIDVQGDEPLIPGKLIDQVAQALLADSQASISTAAKLLEDTSDIENPNIVKVVFSHNGRALYFSRAPIPFARDERIASAWHHIGVYAYRAGFLRNYDKLLESSIERTESLEQLRAMDNGHIIRVESVDYPTGFGVDTPQDLAKVRSLMS